MAQYQTPPGILSYPTFFVPKPRAKDQDPVYNGMLILTEESIRTEYWKVLKAAVEQCAKEGDPKKKLGPVASAKTMRTPFRDAEERDNLPEDAVFFINPWSKRKPAVLDNRRVEIFDSEDVWAGQLARFVVTPFFYNVPGTGNCGVSLGLETVQILKSKGQKRLDGRRAPAEMFDDEYADLEDEEL